MQIDECKKIFDVNDLHHKKILEIGCELDSFNKDSSIVTLQPEALRRANLPFDNLEFDLVICAFVLFFDPTISDENLLIKAILELARVGREVRIFPLTDSNEKPSPYLGKILLKLQEEDYGVEVKETIYEGFKRGNAVLRIWANSCKI